MKLHILLIMLSVVIIVPTIVYFILQQFQLNQYVINGYVVAIASTMFGKWLADLRLYLRTRKNYN